MLSFLGYLEVGAYTPSKFNVTGLVWALVASQSMLAGPDGVFEAVTPPLQSSPLIAS